MISFHCATFQPKKFTILLTSLTHSTLQISSFMSEYTVFLDTEVFKGPRLSTHTILHLLACVQTSPFPQKKSGEETSVNH